MTQRRMWSTRGGSGKGPRRVRGVRRRPKSYPGASTWSAANAASTIAGIVSSSKPMSDTSAHAPSLSNRSFSCGRFEGDTSSSCFYSSWKRSSRSTNRVCKPISYCRSKSRGEMEELARSLGGTDGGEDHDHDHDMLGVGQIQLAICRHSPVRNRATFSFQRGFTGR